MAAPGHSNSVARLFDFHSLPLRSRVCACYLFARVFTHCPMEYSMDNYLIERCARSSTLCFRNNARYWISLTIVRCATLIERPYTLGEYFCCSLHFVLLPLYFVAPFFFSFINSSCVSNLLIAIAMASNFQNS